ncbi:hypothetical protein CK203_040301 [Vitis vinifera]|uniref:Uncharacterized protein n=1 Tax=Vitis vinifera TaxID=29760 RepID=A0A438HXE2_VITVI|nr:hypothetical protein CK203_040301 [Vitis vinifera]
MAKTRGGFPPPHHHRRLDHSKPPWEAPLRHLFRPRPFPPSEGGTPSQRRYPTRRPPTEPVPPTDQAKRPAFLGPLRREPSSRVLESHPMRLRQSRPQRILGFLWVFLPETVIRRPMIAGPPIEGNLDCRDQSFHSETYFDIEALRQQPELRDSFRLLQRVPLGACHIAEALRIPYEPVIQADFREWSSFSQSDMVCILSRGTSTASVLTRRELPSGMLLIDVLLRANIFPLQHKGQRRGAILEALFRISEGYYFGPHHLIMTSFLHFEEKSTWAILKSLVLRGAAIGREDLSLDKWHHLVAYFAPQGAPAVPAPPELPRDEQLPQAQQDEILTDTTPPTLAAHTSMHMPEAIHSTSPITQGAPPVMPATPALPPSSEPTVTVSLTEFKGLVHSLQTLSTGQDSIIHQMATIRAHQDQIIATQTQHTTILHQI